MPFKTSLSHTRRMYYRGCEDSPPFLKVNRLALLALLGRRNTRSQIWDKILNVLKVRSPHSRTSQDRRTHQSRLSSPSRSYIDGSHWPQHGLARMLSCITHGNLPFRDPAYRRTRLSHVSVTLQLNSFHRTNR